MVALFYHNINQEKYFEHEINLDKFDNKKNYIILIFIFGITTFSANKKFTIVSESSINYIKRLYSHIKYYMNKLVVFNRIIEFFKIFDFNRRKLLKNDNNNLEGKQRQKRDNNSIKINNTNNKYIKIVIIKLLIIIKLFCFVESIIYKFNFLQYSKITLQVKGNNEKIIFNNDFKGINHLKFVYINGIRQDKISNKYHFNQINNYVELILDDNINKTDNMFKECTDITEINLSNFDTSLVTSMDNMFEGCSSLTSLDLSNFNTSLVKRMIFMFSRCSSLTSLDLSNFDTSLVTLMDSMFSHCHSLTSLNLSNFNTSLLNSRDTMFKDCINLKYINLYNFEERKIKLNMFENTPNNLVICIKETINKLLYDELNNTLDNASYSIIINKKRYIIDCSNNWKAKKRRKISFKFLSISSNESINPQLNDSLYLLCDDNLYPKEEEIQNFNLENKIECYNEPEGYYLDNNLYKKCYETCKKCTTKGNETVHNCMVCNENFFHAINRNNIKNCYEKCDNYYYFDNENNFHCTLDLSCPDSYPKLIENRNECIESKKAEDIIKDISNIEKNGIL